MVDSKKMDILYEAFLDDLLEVVKSGKMRSQDRAVIRQFLNDHGMNAKNRKNKKLTSLVEFIPHFGEDDDPVMP